jgi:hypothetical protein
MTSSDRSLVELSKRLLERRQELERATLARVHGVSDPTSIKDPDYVVGLRSAVAAALSSGIAAIEGNRRLAPIPTELSMQARHAARNGVCLDTVLRRYFAGYALLCDFIVEEAGGNSGVHGAALQGVLRVEAALLDRLAIAVTDEYTREAESCLVPSTAQRLLERVKELLAGELAAAGELHYELGGWHLGGVASGLTDPSAIHDLAGRLDRGLLLVQSGDKVWFWLGGKRRITSHEVLSLIGGVLPKRAILALGEPGQGLEGWRDTHRQAKAAAPVAMRAPDPKVLRYADVALVASALQDDVLMKSLQDIYLSPLTESRDGGHAYRHTLEAYFAAGRNVSSAAGMLNVSRRTVANRLGAIEKRLGRRLSSCGPELEAALRLDALHCTI